MTASPRTPTPIPPPPARPSSSDGMGVCRGRGMKPKEGGGGLAASSLLENLLPLLHPSFSGGDASSAGGEGGRGVRKEAQIPIRSAQPGGRSLVIGLGNPLRGDDGIGPTVIAALRRSAEDRTTLVESAGNDLAEWLASDAFDRIVIVDAAELGRSPGEWVRLTAEALDSASPGEIAHGLGLAETLRLLETLGVRPAPITVFAVQPATVGWGPGLSREARHAATAVAAAIRRELHLPLPSGRGGTVLRTEQDVRSLPCGGETA